MIRNAAEAAEWQYVYQERLGILEAPEKPTEAQHRLAQADADRYVEILHNAKSMPKPWK